MTQEERRVFLLRYLLGERAEYAGIAVPSAAGEQRRMLRSLMNVRPAEPIGADFLAVQDEYLRGEVQRRGVTDAAELAADAEGLCLWQGDITTLRCGAIVNAANSGMTGCYIPCHGCIDNAIHTYAGVQLRLECARIMSAQGHAEPTGRAKITPAYNLPCRYVLHTVGPIIYGAVTKTDQELLTGCYRSCLDLATAHGLRSVAFCCISTGEFHFPGKLAAEISIQTVKTWQQQNPNQIEVIFNVFKDSDYKIYKRLLR